MTAEDFPCAIDGTERTATSKRSISRVEAASDEAVAHTVVIEWEQNYRVKSKGSASRVVLTLHLCDRIL